MFAHRYLARLGALAGAVLLGSLIASPAAAARVSAHITNLPSSYTLGGQSRSFTAVVESDRSDQIQGRSTWVIIIELDGLDPGQVAVSRAFGGDLPLSGGDGQVRATDQAGFLFPGMTARNSYRLRFGLDAPTGKARVWFEVYGGNGQLIARADARSTSVRAPRGGAVPTRTGTPLPGANGSTFATQEPLGKSESPLVQVAGPQVDSGGVLTLPLYIFGGLLVAGGGVLLWLLLRRNREEAYADAGPPDAGPPHPMVVDSPTLTLPVVQDPVPPLPRRPRQHRMP